MDMLAVPEDRILTVKDGETLDLGEKTLQFIYFPWVHWPETMLTWLPEQKILFSCDLFGSHLATADLFVSDESALLQAAKRYYAEIMMPFREVIAKNFSKATSSMPRSSLPAMARSTRRPTLIIDAYRDWIFGPSKNLWLSLHLDARQHTPYGEHFVEACAERGVFAEQFDLADSDMGKLAMLLVDAAGIVFGSPMVLAGPHPKVAYAAILANALRPKEVCLGHRFIRLGWETDGNAAVADASAEAEVIPPVLVKGLPRAETFAALDALAESVRAASGPPEQKPQQANAKGSLSRKIRLPCLPVRL